MIIKSMVRKAPTFGQLIAYIGRDAKDSEAFAYNLYHSGGQEKLVEAQFLENYRKLPTRKNGNALYHEILALKPQHHLSKKQIAERLRLIALYYCDYRAPQQLVWGKVHHDTDFPHVHLMISANEVYSAKRARLSKAEFATVQRQTEAYVREHFPELTASPVYAPQYERKKTKTTRSEGELVRRTNKPSRKMQAFALLESIFQKASGQSDLEAQLKVSGFRLYQRGKTWGVLHQASGTRYRLTTLGLMPEFERIFERTVGDRNYKKSPATALTKHIPDPRAKQLTQTRQSIENAARDQLEDFDRTHDKGHER